MRRRAHERRASALGTTTTKFLAQRYEVESDGALRGALISRAVRSKTPTGYARQMARVRLPPLGVHGLQRALGSVVVRRLDQSASQVMSWWGFVRSSVMRAARVRPAP